MQSEYIIEMLGIRKEFPGIVANDNITLQLRRGEIHALLGENGAGKSTLMSVLFGLYQPEAGVIKKNGEVVQINNPNDATVWALTKHYENKWSEIGGIATSLGAKENAVGLPVASWSLKNWSVADYQALLAKIVSGEVKVSDALVKAPENSANVTVTYVE